MYASDSESEYSTIKDAVYALFDKHGVENVTNEMGYEAAVRVKPDTKWDEHHLRYWQNQWKKEHWSGEVKFKVGEVRIDTGGCGTGASSCAEEIAAVLKDMEYEGQITRPNARQLNIHFDGALCRRMKDRGWRVEQEVPVDMEEFSRNWGNQTVDAVVGINELPPAVVEIEKSNKKTIWFDFMKLWMCMDSGQASCGLIVCPTNYAHRHGVWNLYEEATAQKRFLRRFARAPEERLSLIGIVGYHQYVLKDGSFVPWDSTEFNRVKRKAGRKR